MAGPVDFLRLYQELNLPAGANLEELKRAYRRRVSELHPDRLARTDAATARHAAEKLQELTVLYGAAIEFHARHDRLPGGIAPRRTFETPPPPSRPVPPEPASSPPRRAWFGIPLLILCGWIFWAAQYPDEDPAASTQDPGIEAVTSPTPPPPREPALRALDLGMSMREVLALQGEPPIRGETRWEYGPSWISFEKGKVSDWHSSPLRPLRQASQNPPPRKDLR
jgi:hypothetical protein